MSNAHYLLQVNFEYCSQFNFYQMVLSVDNKSKLSAMWSSNPNPGKTYQLFKLHIYSRNVEPPFFLLHLQFNESTTLLIFLKQHLQNDQSVLRLSCHSPGLFFQKNIIKGTKVCYIVAIIFLKMGWLKKRIHMLN